MTYVGKILVILIMAFSLIFLGVSTVVFTTAKNWKAETGKLKEQMGTLQKKLTDSNAALAKAGEELKSAQSDREEVTKNLQGRIDELTAQNTTSQKELTEQRTTVATSGQAMNAALADAAANKKETDQLREILATVQQQANEYKLRQTELDDQIRILQRQLDTATTNNKDLRERVAGLSSVLRQNGLSDDVRQIRGLNSVPPDVEGQVTRVDPRNQNIEISIGSDDGLVVGHELEVWRTTPSPEYLGRIRVLAVEPDKAVGTVLGKTIQGKKLQEGDIVSSQIRPRS
jgi:hypothetical protein